eukprot:scaffold156355_cov36-Tisochrysis_lutea.AAC.1
MVVWPSYNKNKNRKLSKIETKKKKKTPRKGKGARGSHPKVAAGSNTSDLRGARGHGGTTCSTLSYLPRGKW